MNTKNLKLLGFFITASLVLALLGYFILNSRGRRNIAAENTQVENLSEKQKQKWLATEQFQIKQATDSLQIEISHIIDLCAENQKLVFQFQAYEIAIAGDRPNIQYFITCTEALAKQQTQFQVLFSDLVSLREIKEKKLADGFMSSQSLYTDEPLPARWNLAEISVEGYSGFKINSFEIQKVFGHNFEFELSSK